MRCGRNDQITGSETAATVRQAPKPTDRPPGAPAMALTLEPLLWRSTIHQTAAAAFSRRNTKPGRGLWPSGQLLTVEGLNPSTSASSALLSATPRSAASAIARARRNGSAGWTGIAAVMAAATLSTMPDDAGTISDCPGSAAGTISDCPDTSAMRARIVGSEAPRWAISCAHGASI